jgi:GNAT superfamily N-acetyltransferase
MRELTGQDKVGGLLAYDGNECVGWIGIDPLAELIGHECQPSATVNDWAIHCLFIRETHRGLGLSGRLICEAIDYAKSRGALIVSAFPIPSNNRSRFPPHEAEFSGRFATYARLGFVPVGAPSDFYQRMEVQIS